ncbi:MAG: hypothetical protein LBB90_10240 [Tannerella sp.]|nr:hypothetical protein [Tannerella sp.]
MTGIDTVVYKTYLEWGHTPLYPECTTRYSHSEDGRQDTTRSTCGMGQVLVLEYDAENRLTAVYRSERDGRDPFVLNHSYEYDAEGRLIRETDHHLQQTYAYDHSTLVDTNMGYISGSAEYELDAEGRLVRLSNNPSSCFVRIPYPVFNGEYDCYYVLKNRADLSEEEKLRAVANETTWTYFENGYEEHSMKLLGGYGDQAMYNRQKTESYTREQERGYSTEKRLSMLYYEAANKWELKDHEETFYYSSDDPAQYVPEVEASARKVYGVSGGIAVSTANAATEEVTVWSVSGALVRRVTVRASAHLPLAKGFYIVTAGREAYKVIVR